MITIRPWEDYAAMAVFNRLDLHDQMEAELVRGVSCTALGLFADWRAAQAHAALSLVIHSGPAARPFAVLLLAHTGQAGVAEAALVAADHARHRWDLGRLGVSIRAQMPGWCAEVGMNRIEARCWLQHPTAARLLQSIGFEHEATLPGFGRDGRATFRQFAWTRPQTEPSTLPPDPTPTPEPQEV
jgi:GNAT superfamily N-acetyltransferase